MTKKLYSTSLLLSLLFLNSYVYAQESVLKCKVSLIESSEASLSSSKTLKAKSSYADSFLNFKVDLNEGKSEAWIHQNLCVFNKDFKNAKFKGPLCLLLLSVPSTESGDDTFNMNFSLSRRAIVQGKLSNGSNEQIDLSIPFDPKGKSLKFTQNFANKDKTYDLSQIDIDCISAS